MKLSLVLMMNHSLDFCCWTLSFTCRLIINGPSGHRFMVHLEEQPVLNDEWKNKQYIKDLQKCSAQACQPQRSWIWETTFLLSVHLHWKQRGGSVVFGSDTILLIHFPFALRTVMGRNKLHIFCRSSGSCVATMLWFFCLHRWRCASRTGEWSGNVWRGPQLQAKTSEICFLGLLACSALWRHRGRTTVRTVTREQNLHCDPPSTGRTINCQSRAKSRNAWCFNQTQLWFFEQSTQNQMEASWTNIDHDNLRLCVMKCNLVHLPLLEYFHLLLLECVMIWVIAVFSEHFTCLSPVCW